MIAIIDTRMPKKAKETLMKRFPTIELPPSPDLDSRVASHPDMLMFSSNGRLFINENYFNITKDLFKIKDIDIIRCDGKLSEKYPDDIAFNCFISNGTLFGNISHTAKEIITFANEQGISKKAVSQGYAKCSTVVLGNDRIITADKSIYKAYTQNSDRALLVSPKGVSLNGYNCGFIGGATGVLDKEIFFSGDISLHPDYQKIQEFTKKLGYKITSLSNEPLYDVGTILFI